MIGAVVRGLVRENLWFSARRVHLQLNRAAALERDEPERRVANAMLTGCQQPVALMQNDAIQPDLSRDRPAALFLHRHRAGRGTDHGVVVIEAGSIVAEHVQLAARGTPGAQMSGARGTWP